MQCSAYIHCRDATDLAQGSDKGVNSGVVGSLFFVAEALDKRRCLVDWEPDIIVGAEQRDCLDTVTFFSGP